MHRYFGIVCVVGSITFGVGAVAMPSPLAAAPAVAVTEASFSTPVAGLLVGQMGPALVGEDKWNDKHSIGRPKAAQISILKIGLVIVVFLLCRRMGKAFRDLRQLRHESKAHQKLVDEVKQQVQNSTSPTTKEPSSQTDK